MSINGNVTPKDENGAPIVRSSAFSDASGFRARFKGITGVAAANSITNIDYKLTEDRFINGVHIITVGSHNGDFIGFWVVDKDYLFAGTLYPSDYNGIAWSVAQPDGVILDEFGSNWYMDSTIQTQSPIIVSYPARIMSGLSIRAVYNNTGNADVTVYCNLHLHWKRT